jgi:redox-sensitive bicupin YhaK (pirin superfamily)
VHFLQIWIMPERRNIAPGYEQKAFDLEGKRGVLQLVASRDGREGSITVHQDVALYAGRFDAGQSASMPIAKGRGAWVQVARGRVHVNGTELQQGDGAAIENESKVRVQADDAAEVLIFDLA